MIRFRCKNCGQKICVEDDFAGNKGRCPHCKQIISISCPDNKSAVQSEVVLQNSGSGASVFDISPKTEVPTDYSAGSENHLYPDHINAAEQDKAPERKYPWLIDVFLYPANKSGLTILGIIVGIPLLLRILSKFLFLFTTVFPPGLVFLTLVFVVRILLGGILSMYACWYFCRCIYESGFGAIRAPETVAVTPGLAELFRKFFMTISCCAMAFLPACIYYIITRQFN